MSITTRIEEVYQKAGLATMEQYHIRAIIPERTRIDLKVLGDKLLQRTRVNYEDSVDVGHPVCVDQKANPEWNQDHFCWEAKGKCAQDYQEVETKLLKELDQSRRESFCEVGVSLFMIGKTPRKAKPVIIISSQDQRSRKEAKKAITRSGILADLDFELGVLKYLPSGPIHPIAGSPSEASWDSASESGGWDSDTWETAKPALSHQMATLLPLPAYYDPKQRLRITGMSLYVKTTDNQSRMGTANVVHNGSTYGYITAAHIFSPFRPAPPSIDDGEEDLGVPFDSDSDDEDDSDAKRSCAGSPISNPTKTTEPHIPDQEKIKLPRLIGCKVPSDSSEATTVSPPNLALLGHLAPEESELSMDYAIIAMKNTELVQQLEHSSVSEGIQSARAYAAAPKPSQATAWTTHGPIHGTLTSVPTLMRLPGSRLFQPVFTFAYEGTIEYGDSGSLVLHTASKELCGMVIAASDRQSIAYIVSAGRILKAIAKRGWRLLSVDDAYMESGESYSEKVYAPTIQSTQALLPAMKTSQAEPSSNNILQATSLSGKPPTRSIAYTSNWVWSDQYQNYYRVTYDVYREYYPVLIKLKLITVH
ncbi:hypothetical protein J4E80_006748 [Alternaria sp. BMP 0032]|nr:hypothetical protein J4E80_006748 [Alternaria sp. BMP 0032]